MSVEFVGIELDLMGAEAVRRDLENLDRLVNSLGGKKKVKLGIEELQRDILAGEREVKVLTSELKSAERELENLRKKAEASKNAMSNWGDAFKNSAASTFAKQNIAAFEEASKAVAKQRDELAKATTEWQENKMAVKEAQMAYRQAGETFKQTFNKISSGVAHAGSAMQSFGNALTQLTSPFRRFTSGILMGAGYKALNSFTEGFERGFTRYDTMKKYPKIMAAFGYSAEQAEESIKALDMSVRGLPTGLDEMVDLAQRFTATTGDIEKGTKLAIAANNAFLASMSTDTQKYQGMMQLQDVLGGKDMNAREWNSLVSSMTPAIVKMGESLGYTSDNMGEWIQKVRDGKVSNEDFIDTLIKIGNEGGVLEAMAQESKNTWQAFFANVGNASSRMLAGILKAFDEVSQAVAGKDVNQLFADTIIPGIDKATESIKKWIQAHPEEITRFFQDLKKIKIGNFFRGYAKGLELMVGLVEKLGTALGKYPKLMGFLGGFFGLGGMVGRMSTIFGGLLKGTRHIWAGIGTVGSFLLKGRFGKLGLFGKIASIFGKKKDIEEVGEIGKAVTTASPKLLSAFKNMALLSGIIATPAITAWGVTEAVKRSIKNFKETINLLKDMDWGAAAKLAGGIATFLGASAGLGAIVGKFGIGAGIDIMFGEVIVGLITSIATGFFDLDMAFIKGGIEKFVESVKLLSNIPDVSTFGDVKTKIANAIDLMNEITELLQPRYVDKGVSEGGIQGIGLGTAWAINGIAKALAPLKDAVQSINEIASMSISEGAADRIGKIIDTISEIQSKMWKLMGFGFGNIKNNMTKVADAMYELRRVIYHVRKLAGEKISTKGLENVTDAISKIREAFDAKTVSDIRGTITAFVASIQDAFTQLDKLNSPIEIKASVKLSKDFKTSVDAVVREIGLAKQRINLAWAGIPTSFTKTITFNLNGKIKKNDIYDSSINGAGYHQAKGGLIYRAGGGGVPFKRRGTDTVPAMLTPGEYVHNKRAVSAFGIDFMRKVNNLDMKGAMNELMHRAGHMANINRGTNITNNYNNNQKVVINNSNAGAGYTFKAASRFVGAF